MSSSTITAAVIISRSEQMQDACADMYRELATRFSEQAEDLTAFAKRCERNKVQIVRTYQETVSDALETNFAFADLALPEALDTQGALRADDWTKAAAEAIAIEETIITFYQQVAEACESLLATIPSAYRRVIKARQRRIKTLGEL